MKEYTKLARKECVFDGFIVPKGAIYGRLNSRRFICVNFSGESSLKIIVKDDNSPWRIIIAKEHDWRYIRTKRLIAQLGYTPKVCPIIGKIPGVPVMRDVNYNYIPTGSGAGTLARMRHDNADHYGGGSVIHNGDSYRQIYKDMERRCLTNPLYE